MTLAWRRANQIADPALAGRARLRTPDILYRKGHLGSFRSPSPLANTLLGTNKPTKYLYRDRGVNRTRGRGKIREH